MSLATRPCRTWGPRTRTTRASSTTRVSSSLVFLYADHIYKGLFPPTFRPVTTSTWTCESIGNLIFEYLVYFFFQTYIRRKPSLWPWLWNRTRASSAKSTDDNNRQRQKSLLCVSCRGKRRRQQTVEAAGRPGIQVSVIITAIAAIWRRQWGSHA